MTWHISKPKGSLEADVDNGLIELIKHTTDDHSDLPGLTEALKAAEEIANMSEDYHTKLIKIFHNMLQSIQNCPVST